MITIILEKQLSQIQLIAQTPSTIESTFWKRGSTHFDKEFEGLSPEDKVSLYCLYYVPMHLFSSYHVFTKYLTLASDKIVFIDFGCGPLTSGIAFLAAFERHSDITCISIDESRVMRDKASMSTDTRARVSLKKAS